MAKNLLEALEANGAETVLMVEKLADRHYPVSPHIKLINLDMSPRNGAISRLSNLFRHFLKIRAMVRKEAPDAILSFGAPANCSVLLSLLSMDKRIRPKAVISEHTEEMFLDFKAMDMKSAVLRVYYRFLMFLTYPLADNIITVSSSIASRIKKMNFVSRNKVKVIYNPVNIEKIHKLRQGAGREVLLREGLPCVGTVTRLSPEKGTHFLLHGFKELLDKVESRLVIVGGGPEKGKLEKLAAELGLAEKVVFTGWVEDPFKYLAVMDVFVLPSSWEGFPNVILEAMACGVPVIAADSAGGIREAIQHGVNGLLIKPGSPNEIAEAVYGLLSDTKKRRAITEEASRGVKRYEINNIGKQYEMLLYN